MVKQISDNEIYLLIKYIKSILWSVAKRLSHIEDAWCLKVNETDRYLDGADLLYLSVWFFIILGYCQRQQAILQDLFLSLWRLNNKSLRILHGRWVLTAVFATNDTDFNFDDGSEGLLSQLQEEESRTYCNFYCSLNGNAI